MKNPILDYVQDEELLWYCHVKRMSEKRILKKVLECLKRGRPNTYT